MKYFFAAFSGILLVIIIAGAAFYFGQKSANPSKEMATTPTPTASQTTTTQKATSSTPTPKVLQTQTITAGGVLSFPTYTLELPKGWVYTRKQGQDNDKLTLTKLNYKITIYEAAFGGGGCLYPGDAPSEMAQTYTIFTEIINPNGYVFRRGMSGPNTWAVCQKNTSDGSFGAPTIFGHIAFETPGTPDKNGIVFPEVDSILASLNKK